MNREQFMAASAHLDEAGLRKALWTLYWRGTATVRERIEEAMAPEPATGARRAAPVVRDPEQVLAAVQEFTALVRSGAYLGRNRAVSPKERSQWRFTFRRLIADARSALAADDPADAEVALAELIDLACAFRHHDYVRSQDPIEAAAIVVSDEVAILWRQLLDRHGFATFAATAAGQFLRWESRFGWTRSGFESIAARESSLTEVLTGLLVVPDTWVTFTEQYLRALDDAAPRPVELPRTASERWAAEHRQRDEERRRGDRAEAMIGWHLALQERLLDSEDAALLDRIAEHPALGGPELDYFRARLAHARGDLPAAHRLVHAALERLPGHQAFLAFAQRIEAPLPERAARIVADRRRGPD